VNLLLEDCTGTVYLLIFKHRKEITLLVIQLTQRACCKISREWDNCSCSLL